MNTKSIKWWCLGLVTVVGVLTATEWATGWPVRAAVQRLIPATQGQIDDAWKEIADNSINRLKVLRRDLGADKRALEADIYDRDRRGLPVPPKWKRDLERYNEDAEAYRKRIEQLEKRKRR